MAFPTPDFTPEAIAAAKAHALSSWPLESCGLIVGGEYLPCENISATPEDAFRIADSTIAQHGAAIQAVVHSHPKGVPSPSSADMVSQISMDCIFGIIPCNKNEVLGDIVWFGDFLLEQPLIGQKFIHGVTDCFTTVRGYFWQTKGVKLPDLPRDADWWKDNQNLYVENFERMGFTLVDRSEAAPGDCFLGKVRSPVPNHGGVILERGLGLHHLDGRLSRREPLLRWERFITHFLRYTGGA